MVKILNHSGDFFFNLVKIIACLGINSIPSIKLKWHFSSSDSHGKPLIKLHTYVMLPFLFYSGFKPSGFPSKDSVVSVYTDPRSLDMVLERTELPGWSCSSVATASYSLYRNLRLVTEKRLHFGPSVSVIFLQVRATVEGKGENIFKFRNTTFPNYITIRRSLDLEAQKLRKCQPGSCLPFLFTNLGSVDFEAPKL